MVGRLIDSILTDLFDWERKSVREAATFCDPHKPAAPPARPFVNIHTCAATAEGRVGRTPPCHDPKVQPGGFIVTSSLIERRLVFYWHEEKETRVPPVTHTGKVDTVDLRLPADFRGHSEACLTAMKHLTAFFFSSLFVTVRAEWSGQPA